MKTFLIVMLVLFVLVQLSHIYKMRSINVTKNYLQDVLNKINSIKPEQEKTVNIVYWSLMGLFYAFEIAIVIMLFIAIA